MEKQTKKARPHHLYLIQGTPHQKKKNPKKQNTTKKFGQNSAKQHQIELTQNQASASIGLQPPSRTNTHRKSTTNWKSKTLNQSKLKTIENQKI
jgi:hypothetical protein